MDVVFYLLIRNAMFIVFLLAVALPGIFHGNYKNGLRLGCSEILW